MHMNTKKLFSISASLLTALSLCALPITQANAQPVVASTEAQAASISGAPTFSAAKIDEGVRVNIGGAVFVMNGDGSVSVNSPDGRIIDSLPATSMQGSA